MPNAQMTATASFMACQETLMAGSKTTAALWEDCLMWHVSETTYHPLKQVLPFTKFLLVTRAQGKGALDQFQLSCLPLASPPAVVICNADNAESNTSKSTAPFDTLLMTSYQTPVPVGQARRIISIATAARTLSVPVLVYCRPAHCIAQDSLEYLGVHQVKDSNGFHFQTLRVSAVSVPDDAQETWKQCMNGIIGNDTPRTIAHYEMISAGAKSDGSARYIGAGPVVNVDVSWTEATAPFASPPLSGMVTVMLRGAAGTAKTILADLEWEMSRLEGFVEGLGYSHWPVDTNRSVNSCAAGIYTFLRNEEVISLGGEPEVLEETSVDSLAGELSFRTDNDFLDRLWMFLRDAKDVQDLQSALSSLFKALEKGELLPMVSKNNHTELAEFIREAIKINQFKRYGAGSVSSLKSNHESIQEAAAVWKEKCESYLESTRAMSLLVEIGLKKVMKDYVHALTTSQTRTQTHAVSTSIDALAWYTDETAAPDVQVHRLHRLQNVLELCVLLRRYNVPWEAQREVLSKSLDFYHENSSRSLPMFRVALSPMCSTKMIAKLKAYSPVSWHIETLPEGKGSSATTSKVTLQISPHQHDAASTRNHSEEQPDVPTSQYKLQVVHQTSRTCHRT